MEFCTLGLAEPVLHYWFDDWLPAPHYEGQGGQDPSRTEPCHMGSHLISGLPSGVWPILDQGSKLGGAVP